MSFVDIVASALKNQSTSKVSKAAGYVLENRKLIRGIVNVVASEQSVPVETMPSASQRTAAEYIGVLGKDIFLSDIENAVGKDFHVTMIYYGDAEQAKYPHLFAYYEKTAKGVSSADFFAKDETDEDIWLKLRNYTYEDGLALKVHVHLDGVIEYEETQGENEKGYIVSILEAEFLEEDSVESKLASSNYYVVGNTICEENGLSIHISEAGMCCKDGISCAYIKIEALNCGEDEECLPYVEFYGDDYLLEEAEVSDNLNLKEVFIAPRRKTRGTYYASLGGEEYKIIEAEVLDEIVMIKYPRDEQ